MLFDFSCGRTYYIQEMSSYVPTLHPIVTLTEYDSIGNTGCVERFSNFTDQCPRGFNNRSTWYHMGQNLIDAYGVETQQDLSSVYANNNMQNVEDKENVQRKNGINDPVHSVTEPGSYHGSRREEQMYYLWMSIVGKFYDNNDNSDY